MYIITEILGPSLYDTVLVPKKVLKPLELKLIVRDILTAFTFFKSRGIIHCDLKPENILFLTKKSPNVKIVDFGSSTFMNDVDYTYLQTRPYRAPEITFGCKFDFAVDMWSLGCVLYELIAFRMLFKYKTVEENIAKAAAINRISGFDVFARGSNYRSLVVDNRFLNNTVPMSTRSINVELVVPNESYDFATELRECGCTPDLVDFIQGCLKLNPAERLTAEEAMEHVFMRVEDAS